MSDEVVNAPVVQQVLAVLSEIGGTLALIDALPSSPEKTRAYAELIPGLQAWTRAAEGSRDAELTRLVSKKAGSLRGLGKDFRVSHARVAQIRNAQQARNAPQAGDAQLAGEEG